MKNIFGKCKIINFTLTSVAQWVKINPFFIHHTYADRLSERIRVLYRNQGFLPHKWVTIVAASLPQQQLQPTKIAAYRIDSITTI